MKAIACLLGVLVTLPIWFWLLYQVLDRVNASELMWFLYWAYVPCSLFVQVLLKLAEEKGK